MVAQLLPPELPLTDPDGDKPIADLVHDHDFCGEEVYSFLDRARLLVSHLTTDPVDVHVLGGSALVVPAGVSPAIGPVLISVRLGVQQRSPAQLAALRSVGQLLQLVFQKDVRHGR